MDSTDKLKPDNVRIGSPMIDLYTWSTPNGRKVSIMLEACGLPYRVMPVDITRDQQFSPEFLAISPNNRIPAIVDPEGPGGEPISLFESGAILLYLAEKTGRYLPAEPRARYRVMQWLMWQMGGFGPMLGQAHHFRRFAKAPIPYAIDRYSREAERLWRVLDRQLAGRPYIADELSIADFAAYPWAMRCAWQGIEPDQFPQVQCWMNHLAAEPFVARGMAVPDVG